MKSKERILKITYVIVALLGLFAAMLVLNHTAQNGRRITEVLPEIVEEPVYVECIPGQPIEIALKPREDFSIGGFRLLLVNISQESRGTVRFAVTDSASKLLINQVIPVETIAPGKWFSVPAQISFTEGETYVVSVLADGSEPYFMQRREGAADGLPFEEKVTRGGEEMECGVSLGVEIAEQVKVTYGEILYYSVPLCIFTAAFLIVCILFGKKRVWEFFGRIPIGRFLGKYGNDLFLLLLFAAVCLSIYSRAYVKGVYISSDSAGYLREAVNLAKGYGFNYDGMAGYDSWFANWPILYPAMITIVMAVTGANAYLASKILAMVLVGALLVMIRLCFKKDAWFYGLCVTNIGFLNLAYYTWSEIPFMVFLSGFALVLARILRQEEPQGRWYFLLGLLGLGCFLTRYFGIFVWIVTGLYLLCMIRKYVECRDKKILKKTVLLAATAFGSGILSMAYLFVNKLKNGMASGVSRTLWWDDYEKLTNDLIESLLTEVCNVFSIQIPELIEGFPYDLKVFVIVVILAGLVWFVAKNGKHFSTESVMLTMGVMYYLIFIVIRYFSSMDTFYFRFFEPASFLICIGLMGLLLPYLRGKKGFHFFGGAMAALVVLAMASVLENGGLDVREGGYYDELTRQWQEAYEEIPEKSVVIFNDIDFRASFYRPDVVEGTVSPAETFEDVKETYYGSEYLCVRREFAEVMLESGEYEQSVASALEKGLGALAEGKEFVVIELGE